jgi:hypothetical protein
VRKPSETISDDQAERKVKPGPTRDEPDKQKYRENRANVVKQTRQRFAVFQQIEVPKLAEILYSLFAH